MQSWSVHPLGHWRWFALARTAADKHVNMADDIDQDFVQMKTEMNKIWLMTLVRLTVQCACYANETHENETKKTSIFSYLYSMGVYLREESDSDFIMPNIPFIKHFPHL